jgi:hypothetical protein
VPSLPGIFGTGVRAGFAAQPYLHAEPGALACWKERLAHLPGRFRVGLVWAGNPAHRNDGNRSIPVEALGPLLSVADVGWVSLQIGPRAGDLCKLSMNGQVTDLAPLLDNMAETAAAICQLDLVITVDTAVAHLAGALGRPVWVMTPRTPDWRWLLDRTSSPWYPSIRLFRQSRAGEWADVVAQVAAALVRQISAGRGADREMVPFGGTNQEPAVLSG